LHHDLDEIIASIKVNEPAIRAEGVAHLAIFGSRTRGEARTDSDLDVLIDFAPGRRFSLLNLCGVGLLIEDATGLPTQVVLSRSSPPEYKSRIATDLTPVF
jgi:predicted nucleotidyltransferase